jgi:hypothetical protein
MIKLVTALRKLGKILRDGSGYRLLLEPARGCDVGPALKGRNA